MRHGRRSDKGALSGVNPKTLSVEIKMKIKEAVSLGVKKKLTKRLKVVEAFRKSDNKPELDDTGCHSGNTSGSASACSA